MVEEQKKSAIVYLTYIVYILFCFIPLFRLGICCGDDLYWQNAVRHGVDELARSLWNEAKYQGRFLAMMQLPSLILSFFDNLVLFKLSKVFFILFDCFLVSNLLERFTDKSTAKINMILFPLFVQIAFQNSPPECYTIFILLPLAYFLMSCILFDDYLKGRGRHKLIVSLILLFMALCCYELFIVYCPLLFFVAMKNKVHQFPKGLKVFGESIKSVWLHICIAIIYLGIYAVGRVLFPSNYNGVKIEIHSATGVLNILKMLITSGIPGAYQYDAEVAYLVNTSRGEYVNVFDNLNFLDCRLVVVLILLSVLLAMVYVHSKSQSAKTKTSRYILCIGGLVYFIVVPPVLNAVSASWQIYAENKGRVIGTTVSYLIQIAVVCVISIIISAFFDKIFSYIICVIVLCIWGGNVQVCNDTLSKLQQDCYNRIENTENLLSKELVDRLGIDKIYAPEIYQSVLMIGIRDEQWSSYAEYKGLQLEINKYYKGENWYLDCNDVGDVFWISTIRNVDEQGAAYGDNIIILSKKKLNGEICLFRTKEDAEKYVEVKLAGEDSIGDFWMYSYAFKEDIMLDDIFIIK